MTRKSKTDWLRAGHELLMQYGADGLNVEKLAAQTGVTKGSFYHHFPNLSGFKTELIAYLEQVGYWDVVQRVESTLPPFEQLRQLTHLISRYDLREDKAIRDWGERDAQARALVERVDERRVTYLNALFMALLQDPARAQFMARLAYAFFLGSAQIQPRIEGREYMQMVRLLETLSTQPIPEVENVQEG